MIQIMVLVVASLLPPIQAHSQPGYIEVTAPGNRQLRMVIPPPRSTGQSVTAVSDLLKSASEVVANDLNLAGVVVAELPPRPALPKSSTLPEVDFLTWQGAGFDLLVQSEFTQKGDQLTIEFRLFDVISRKLITAKRFLGVVKDIRWFSHQFADEVARALTGEAGAFASRIAFVSNQSGNKEIYVMDWDGANPQQLTRNGSINMNPAFSPDGKSLLYTSYKRSNPDLYRYSLGSGYETILSARKGLNITGSWSPDGSKIAVALSKDGDAEIYTLDKDGGHPVRLTINAALDLYPAWSPDGSQIAFVSDRLGKPQLFIMNADGSNVRRLTTSGTYNVNPRWSPKGDKIAYSRMTDGVFQIFVITPDGAVDVQLTSEGSNENPSWSPDGRLLCFSSKRNGGNGIYVMRSDGTAQTRVSQGKGAFFQPSWSPRL